MGKDDEAEDEATEVMPARASAEDDDLDEEEREQLYARTNVLTTAQAKVLAAGSRRSDAPPAPSRVVRRAALESLPNLAQLVREADDDPPPTKRRPPSDPEIEVREETMDLDDEDGEAAEPAAAALPARGQELAPRPADRSYLPWIALVAILAAAAYWWTRMR